MHCAVYILDYKSSEVLVKLLFLFTFKIRDSTFDFPKVIFQLSNMLCDIFSQFQNGRGQICCILIEKNMIKMMTFYQIYHKVWSVLRFFEITSYGRVTCVRSAVPGVILFLPSMRCSNKLNMILIKNCITCRRENPRNIP